MTREKKYTLLSLLLILGLVMCGLSNGSSTILLIGRILCGIGGFSAGVLISIVIRK